MPPRGRLRPRCSSAWMTVCLSSISSLATCKLLGLRAIHTTTFRERVVLVVWTGHDLPGIFLKMFELVTTLKTDINWEDDKFTYSCIHMSSQCKGGQERQRPRFIQMYMQRGVLRRGHCIKTTIILLMYIHIWGQFKTWVSKLTFTALISQLCQVTVLQPFGLYSSSF